jgi:hypothetical protein
MLFVMFMQIFPCQTASPRPQTTPMIHVSGDRTHSFVGHYPSYVNANVYFETRSNYVGKVKLVFFLGKHSQKCAYTGWVRDYVVVEQESGQQS